MRDDVSNSHRLLRFFIDHAWKVSGGPQFIEKQPWECVQDLIGYQDDRYKDSSILETIYGTVEFTDDELLELGDWIATTADGVTGERPSSSRRDHDFISTQLRESTDRWGSLVDWLAHQIIDWSSICRVPKLRCSLRDPWRQQAREWWICRLISCNRQTSWKAVTSSSNCHTHAREGSPKLCDNFQTRWGVSTSFRSWSKKLDHHPVHQASNCLVISACIDEQPKANR